MSSFKDSNLFQAWLVLLLATVFGSALAGVQTKLGPVIEANKTRETLAKIPALVLGEDQAAKLSHQKKSLSITSRTIELERNGIKKFYTVYDAAFEDGTLAGYVAKAAGQGYADKIELLLGLDADARTITGLFILDQKETPGLGNRIIETMKSMPSRVPPFPPEALRELSIKPLPISRANWLPPPKKRPMNKRPPKMKMARLRRTPDGRFPHPL
jgi:Na+-translocating ferredoxin:NAD+ oxidoreductase RnfG subunit